MCVCVCMRKRENAFFTFSTSYGFELHVVHGLQCSVPHSDGSEFAFHPLSTIMNTSIVFLNKLQSFSV